MIHDYTRSKKYTTFKYEKNNILIRNKKTKQKNKLDEKIMTHNKNKAINEVKCKIYSQVLTSSFVSN